MTDRLVDPTRQGIAPPEPRAPGDVDWTGRAKPVPLADAISMVDAWAPDFAPFTMHQMCRALREGIEDLQVDAANDGGHIQSLNRAIEAICEAVGFPRGDAQWPDWLAGLRQKQADDEARLGNLRRENDELRRELHARVIPEQEMEHDIGRALETITAYDAAEQRMLAAIPCGPERDGGTCTLSGHPYAACCRLRVALRFGEAVETDYLRDSGGEVHLFAAGRGKDQVRVSAGCVKLVEPTLYERNETMDYDFDRSAKR